MRNPERIDKVMSSVAELWKKYPDWRLMQLINNIQRVYGNDMFYVEDETFVKIIAKLIEEGF